MLLFAFQSVNKTSFYRVELLSVKVRDRGRGLREVLRVRDGDKGHDRKRDF